MAKICYVKSVHRGHEHVYKGTMEELLSHVFGYTLECGHSWNKKIPEEPKTQKSLVKALNDSAYELNHYHDSYYESNEEEYQRIENKAS